VLAGSGSSMSPTPMPTVQPPSRVLISTTSTADAPLDTTSWTSSPTVRSAASTASIPSARSSSASRPGTRSGWRLLERWSMVTTNIPWPP
jgi:hypothetical protein